MQSTKTNNHSFLLKGSRSGVLLIHGLTGTPNEMRLLGKGLHKQGYTVLGMQLAGHCGTVEDLVATRWQDWYQTVNDAANELLTQVDELFVAGLSMGALLALKLAIDRPQEVKGVAAYSPVFTHDGWSMPLFTKISFILPYFKMLGIGKSRVFNEQAPYGIKDSMTRNRIIKSMLSGQSHDAGLPGNPWFALAEMYKLAQQVKRTLPTLQVPCLVIHSVEDDIASPKNANLIQNKAQQTHVSIVWLNDSFHLITIDKERRKVIQVSADFFEQCQQQKITR